MRECRNHLSSGSPSSTRLFLGVSLGFIIQSSVLGLFAFVFFFLELPSLLRVLSSVRSSIFLLLTLSAFCRAGSHLNGHSGDTIVFTLLYRGALLFLLYVGPSAKAPKKCDIFEHTSQHARLKPFFLSL